MAPKTAICYFVIAMLFWCAATPTRASGLLPTGSARAFRWKAARIQVGISSSLLRDNSNITRGSDVEGAVRRSLATWENVANVEFLLVPTEKQNASPAGPAGDGVSVITSAGSAENAQLFTKESEQAAATTRIFYSGRGFITEADIVLNPYQQFSTDGTFGTFDLESTITHEIGHLLGLEHSPILGSTMHETFGKNGVYGVQNFAARTLSASDVAAVRAIYGARDDARCCGQVTGKLSLANGRAPKNAEVWLEDDNGLVAGETISSVDGSFRFSGLEFGSYRVYAQDSISKPAFAAQLVGEVSVAKEDNTTLTKRISTAVQELELSYVGFNGQLSDVAVSVNPGRTYTIYLGGKNLDPRALTVSFNSPFLTVVPHTLRSQEYEQIDGISFDVRVDPRTPNGDYSIAVSGAKGKAYIVGGISVESHPNPLSSFPTDE